MKMIESYRAFRFMHLTVRQSVYATWTTYITVRRLEKFMKNMPQKLVKEEVIADIKAVSELVH